MKQLVFLSKQGRRKLLTSHSVNGFWEVVCKTLAPLTQHAGSEAATNLAWVKHRLLLGPGLTLAGGTRRGGQWVCGPILNFCSEGPRITKTLLVLLMVKGRKYGDDGRRNSWVKGRRSNKQYLYLKVVLWDCYFSPWHFALSSSSGLSHMLFSIDMSQWDRPSGYLQENVISISVMHSSACLRE